MDSTVRQDLHHSFVELENLEKYGDDLKWVERARWIKFEEDVDVFRNKWCAPYIPALSFKALSELKRCLRVGNVCIGLQEDNFCTISKAIVKQMLEKGLIKPKHSEELCSILMAKNKHIRQELDAPKLGQKWLSAVRNRYSGPKSNTVLSIEMQQSRLDIPTIAEEDDSGTSVDNTATCVPHKTKKLVDISSKLSPDTEVTTILTAGLDYIKQPMAIFIKLHEAAHLGNLNEVIWPVRFICFIAGPRDDHLHTDYFQLGRCIGTLMSDSHFLTLAYCSQVGDDLISGINRFLEDSLVIPPGDWNKHNLRESIPKWKFHVERQNEAHANIVSRGRRHTSFIPTNATPGVIREIQQAQNKDNDEDPLERTGRPFGCLCKDIKRKIPHYIDDFTQILDFRCLAAILFSYLAALAPCITFGALMSEQTKDQLDLSGMIIATGSAGVIFSLFAGQPLIIIGATGPMLILESTMYEVAAMLKVEFLPWRAWIGMWVVVICLVFIAFDLCGLVRQVTRFTEEIFTALVSIIFIHKALSFILMTFKKHPIKSHTSPEHCVHLEDILNHTISLNNMTYHLVNQNFSITPDGNSGHPSYFLMTVILIILTLLLAFFFEGLRSSRYFSLKIRHIISDFGISIAVGLVVAFDRLLLDDFTKKLSIKSNYFSRKWIVNPLGENKNMHVGYIFFAAAPAFLVSIILFLETGVTSVMLDKKENKLKKGSGYHLDLLLVALLCGISSIFGLPWICGSPVNSLSHFHTLTVLSSNHAPGANPYIIKVREQRVTNMVIHILIGGSVLLIPMLELMPVAILFGVFLYLGITSLQRMEFVHRLQLLFIPYKLHPDTRFVRKVQTRKIHMFTLIQLVCIIILAIVKETRFAAIFPFLVLCLVPLRKFLRIIFTEEELEDLDNEEDEDAYGVPEDRGSANFRVSLP